MNNEQDREEMDKLVSETYRELGVERAPENLNQAILRMAADGARHSGTNSLLFAAWMKPVAWAATIGLTLAIVLEVTDVPDASVQPAVVPAVETVREEFVPEDAQLLENAKNQARMQSGQNRQSLREDQAAHQVSSSTIDNSPKLATPEVEPTFEEVVLDDVGNLNSKMKREVNAVAAPAGPLPASTHPEPRKRAADLPVSIEETAVFAITADSVASALIAACDMATRQSAEDWLECIEKLRASGAVEAADLEYEAYIIEYPVASADIEPNK